MILFCTDATRWHTRPCTATESSLIYGWHGSGPKPTVTTGITKWFNGRSEPTEGNEIPTSSLTLLAISKPDKTPFCFSVYCLSHDLFHAIYSENKDFRGYILLEKHLRSLDISVNVLKRMKGCKKLTICLKSFYSVSVENYSIDKVIPHVKR